MAGPSRVNPTLFDKLVGGVELRDVDAGPGRTIFDTFSVPNIERFNEQALRTTVKRDLALLLNTTNLGSSVDLDPYPHVKTSVLNYGVPDLSGKASSRRMIQQRAREIRSAILAFEPRIAPNTLTVDPVEKAERENAVTYLVAGEVHSAVRAMPVKFRTDVEADTATVTVRD